jgi:pyruvate/2-oxoglutarate dehydrogenase complex dihydrolipoamide acyltransferase (E2) component
MTANEFRLPDIGEGLVEVEIVQWLVPIGGQVKVDEDLVEVETDKATTAIPSPFAGTVIHHGADEGDVLEVGKTLVVIGEPGETWSPSKDSEPSSSADAKPIVGSLVEEPEDLTPVQEPVQTSPDRRAALPLVRKLAKELGVDLERVSGSGPNGRITRKDVEAAAAAKSSTSTAPPATARPGDERRRMSRLRKAIADNMSRSWSEIPHVTAFDEVDATRLLAVRSSLQRRHGVSLPVDALVVAAVVPALGEVPVFNASLDGDDLLYHGRHDIGVAVDTPDGVIVTVITEAGSRSVLELGAEIGRLRERARSRKLAPAETSGQTFTVTNIGAAGGGFGTPLVPPGTVAILSVGQAKERPVARAGRVEIAPVMPLSLSYDHRVADGAVGRRFLAVLVENLSEPALFLA